MSDLPSGDTGILISAKFDAYTRDVPGYVDFVLVTIVPPTGIDLPPGSPSQVKLDRNDPDYFFKDLKESPSDYTLKMRAYTSGVITGYADELADVNRGRTTEIDVSANFNTVVDEIRITGGPYLTDVVTNLRATAYDVNDWVLFFGGGFSWGATDPSIIEVDSQGHARGLKRGYTSVVAWVNNPLVSGSKVMSSLGYIPTHMVMSGVDGGTATGMRTIEGDWYYKYNEAGSATDVAIDDSERVYMAIGNKIVRIDDLSGFGRIEFTLPFTPVSIDVAADDKIYMLDAVNRRIARMDDMFGNNMVYFGSLGVSTNQFMEPTTVSIGRDGAIYVTDKFLDRIARFEDMNGLNWRTLGSTGSGEKQFKDPVDVDVDLNGNIYIMDSGNNRVVRCYLITGGFWTTYGTKGSGNGKFGDITHMSVDEGGLMYVIDAQNNRVVRIASIFGNSWAEYPLSSVGSGRIDVPDY